MTSEPAGTDGLEALLAKVAGPDVLERGALMQEMIAVVSLIPLTDQNLVLALRLGAMANARAQGASLTLDPPSRLKLLQALTERAPDRNPGRALCMALALDLCGGPAEDAVVAVAFDLLRHDFLKINAVLLLQSALRAVGITMTFSSKGLSRIAAAITGNPISIGRIQVCLQYVGLSAQESDAARQLAFQHVVLPVLQALANRNDAASAIGLEHFVYSQHVKPTERPEHHKQVFAAISPFMRQLGLAHRQRLGPLSPVPSRPRPLVAFLLHNGHRLAHVEVLLSFLAGYADASDRPIDPVIYLLSDDGAAELTAACARYGVEVIAPATKVGMVQRFEECRTTLAERGVAGVVFVSLPLYLDYLIGLQLAPVSIWWSMKFPLPNFAGLDGRVFYRMLFAGEAVIDGATWRGGPLGILPPPAVDPAAVQAVREKYKNGPLLGTIAREEKIREPGYLDAVTRIMLAHPTANFLWTGRTALPEILGHFEKSGIAARCHFLGWVDPAVYSRAFDVFLETFPLTGLMSGWAMANGMAVVTAGRLGWLGSMLEGIYDGTVSCSPENRAKLDRVFAAVAGRVPAVWAKDADAFVALADQLIVDADLRQAFGAACQAFMSEFLSDTVGSAVIQARHFADIIAEQSAAAQ